MLSRIFKIIICKIANAGGCLLIRLVFQFADVHRKARRKSSPESSDAYVKEKSLTAISHLQDRSNWHISLKRSSSELDYYSHLNADVDDDHKIPEDLIHQQNTPDNYVVTPHRKRRPGFHNSPSQNPFSPSYIDEISYIHHRLVRRVDGQLHIFVYIGYVDQHPHGSFAYTCSQKWRNGWNNEVTRPVEVYIRLNLGAHHLANLWGTNSIRCLIVVHLKHSLHIDTETASRWPWAFKRNSEVLILGARTAFVPWTGSPLDVERLHSLRRTTSLPLLLSAWLRFRKKAIWLCLHWRQFHDFD